MSVIDASTFKVTDSEAFFYGAAAGDSALMCLDSSLGMVGIGKTNPTATVDIEGDLKVSGDFTVGGLNIVQNGVLNMGDISASLGTYASMGSVPWAQLSANCTYVNMGKIPASAYQTASIPAAAVIGLPTMTWPSLSNVVTWANLIAVSEIPSSAYANASIPVAAIDGMPTLDWPSLVGVVTYGNMGPVPWAELSANATCANIGALSTADAPTLYAASNVVHDLGVSHVALTDTVALNKASIEEQLTVAVASLSNTASISLTGLSNDVGAAISTLSNNAAVSLTENITTLSNAASVSLTGQISTLSTNVGAAISTLSNAASVSLTGQISTLSTNVGAAISTLSNNAAASLTSSLSAQALSNAASFTTSNFSVNGISISGDIMPTTSHIQNIGSSNNRFGAAWVDTLHIATNTLYLGDTPVLGTQQNVVMVTADVDQSINVKTTGLGNTYLNSVSGVIMSVTGLNSSVAMNASGEGGKIMVGATTEIDFTAPNSVFTGNANVTGSLTAGGLTVNGNLVVTGSNFLANVQTVEVQDNIMLLNSGQVGNGVSAGQAGIRIDRGDAPDYEMVFDETQQMFMTGAIGSLETIATRPWATSIYTPIQNTLTALSASISASNYLQTSTAASTYALASGLTTANTNLSTNYLPTSSIASTYAPLTTTTAISASLATLSAAVSASNYLQTSTAASTYALASSLTTTNTNLSTNYLATSSIASTYAPLTTTTAISASIVSLSNAILANVTTSNLQVVNNITAGGTITANGDITAFSDARLKTDLQVITDAVAKVGALHGYTYLRLDQPGNTVRYAGVVAQEVQAVLPEVINVDAESGMLSVAYGNISALLIESIKELAARVALLEAM